MSEHAPKQNKTERQKRLVDSGRESSEFESIQATDQDNNFNIATSHSSLPMNRNSYSALYALNQRVLDEPSHQPRTLQPDVIMTLQKQIGNQAVQRLLRGEHSVQRVPDSPVVQSPAVQMLLQQIDSIWKMNQNPHDVFHLLKSNVAAKHARDPDLLKKLQSILSADALWVAQKILDRKLGTSDGKVEGKKTVAPVPKPIEVVYFQGTSSENALIIAGVHGSERQGMQVAQMVIDELKKAKTKPFYNVIIIPSLFPDNRDFEDKSAKNKDHHELGLREGPTQTNRNFPEEGKRLAEARTNKAGQTLDAQGQPILPENIMLMELMEKFKPKRIASIHGTHGTARAGVFIDKPFLSKSRLNEIKQTAQAIANVQLALMPMLALVTNQTSLAKTIEAFLVQQEKQSDTQQLKEDEKLATQMALQIAHETDKQIGSSLEKRKGVDKKYKDSVAVAGNRIDETKKEITLLWGGGTPGGVSLGSYAPGNGVSVFTIEPAINRSSDDYGNGYNQYMNKSSQKDVLTEAERKSELMSYAEVVLTVFLEDPNKVKDAGFKANYQ